MTDDTIDPAAAIGDTLMRQAFADGSYWSDPDRFAPYFGGTDQPAETARAVVPDAPSSLGPDAMAQGRIIEDMMADPQSAYWRGDQHRSAAEYQEHFRALLRGEAAGEAGPIAPVHSGADVDTPGKRTGYDYSGLPIHSAETRDLVDEFAGHAHDAGFGVERTRDVLQWALTQTAGVTEREFRSWALGRGWTDTHIRHAIDAYREMSKRR
jgi:hypothetical protein